MLILTLRTDKPEAEIGLYDDKRQLGYEVWHAHRELSMTIHQKTEDLLHGQNRQLSDIAGIVCYAGPGSFTGLRIGLTVANTLSYGLGKPVVGAQQDNWIEAGIDRLLAGDSDVIAMPEYGAPVNITVQKK